MGQVKVSVRKGDMKEACKMHHSHGMCGGAYGLAVIGAAVWWVQHSTGFWNGALGILKALVWPAILMYKLLEYLKL